MHILDLKPALPKKLLLEEYETLVHLFPRFSFVPFKHSNEQFFSALYSSKKNAQLLASPEYIKKHGYSGFRDLFFYPPFHIVSLVNPLPLHKPVLEDEINRAYSELRNLKDEDAISPDSFSDEDTILLKDSLKNELDTLIKMKTKESDEMREQIRSSLVSMGYTVVDFGVPMDLDPYTAPISSKISPLESLWSELKKDRELVAGALDSLLVPLFKDTITPKEFIKYSSATNYDKISFHASSAYSRYESIISVKNVESPTLSLADSIAEISTRKAIAVSSKVGNSHHYVQIDFDTKDISSVKEVVDALGVHGGFIVHSGNSFHYHNPSKVYSQGTWLALMEKLKSFPLVGKYWPSFQQEQGFSMLRISPSFEKLYFPKIISRY